jgi:hypothetical protein
MRPIIPLAVLLAAGPVWAAPLPMGEDYQKKADEAPWEWSDERATAADSARQLKGDYKAEVEPRGMFRDRVIRIVKEWRSRPLLRGPHRYCLRRRRPRPVLRQLHSEQ